MLTLRNCTLGIEFGSTRIKAVLVDDACKPVAQGDFTWENRLENGVWTYPLDEVWRGVQAAYAALAADVQAAGADPWDNTLAYTYDDGVFHGYLYAVPDGMGIEFDKNSYLWDAETPIYSRYVMCGHGTRVEERLLAENWQELVSTEDLVVYKRS